MKNASVVTIVVVMLVVVLCCCLCLALATTGLLTFSILNADTAVTWDTNPLPTPVVVRPTYEPVPTQAAGPDDGQLQAPVSYDLVPLDTLIALEQTIVPINDLLELAERLEGKADIPTTVTPVTRPYEVGDRYTFWVTNVDTNDQFQIETILRYATEHAYFWIEEGVRFDENELRELAETFENQIYPTNREFFGSEWTPGVDGDPHLYIVYASGLGSSLAGYFSAADAYHPLAHEYSNAHETFMLNADSVGLDEDFTYGVLAHEFQHMIHWYQDRNESSWLNEGFSELAAFLNGFDVGGSDWYFMRDPDLQLNDWPNDPDGTYPHYGSSFLFVTYFLDRFGEQATQAVVGHPDNGLTSIDAVLAEMEITDPLTGEQIQAEDVFLDWAVTNYLQNDQVGDGRFDYHIYPDAPQADETETFRNCPFEPQTRSVAQFGADYIRLTCSGEYTLRFEGSIAVGVSPADPYSGDYAFWSNKGDESDMTLTQRFDFSQHEGPLTLSYWTWYDLEE
ncbi:MAG: hypothetical protein JW862_05770, partial [Anaerolineales bacterium]|nr:hypothetical protein [Anaerolineales bacterium]